MKRYEILPEISNHNLINISSISNLDSDSESEEKGPIITSNDEEI